MYVAEQIQPEERFIARTEKTKPQIQEHPVTRVQSRADGLFEADFVLELTGVASGKIGNESGEQDKKEHREHYMGMLLSSLSDGEILEFIYHRENSSGCDTRYCWNIKGRCSSHVRDLATQGALNLYHNLDVALRTFSSDYQFTPTADRPVDEESHSWRYELRPLGLVIPATKLRFPGFALPLTISESILLPLSVEGAKARFDAAVTGSAYCGKMSINVTVEPTRLTDSAVAMLSAARVNLHEEEVGQIKYQSSTDSCVLDDGILLNTLAQIETWLSDPRGYRMRCVVTADDQVPQSFLETVGHELFRGSPVAVDIVGQELTGNENGINRNINHSVLDLGNCFHRTTDPSSLFPDPTILSSTGIRQAYRQAPMNLPTHGLLLGYCGHGNRTREVRLPKSDRTKHTYIVGATGAGKSTLLHNMICQDIENGEGVCLIDPHGDLFHQVLLSIPKERAKDVVLVDMCDFDHVIGLNFLECEGPHKSVQMNFIINEMMMIFHRLYDMDKAGGPMFEMYMRNALLLVMDSDVGKATLLDVVRIFEDEEFRRDANTHCRNPMVVSFWNKQAEKAGGEAALRNIAPYITSKLNQFTHNALVRPIVGQATSTIDLRQILDKGQILLVNLSKGLLGELDARLIGMLLIGKLFNAAMSRIDLPPDRRRPYFLYVDEFQNFTTPTFASLMSEARKFGLCLTLANQNLAQLSGHEKNNGVMEAVLGNVATIMFFRMGPKDANELEAYVAPYLDSSGIQYLPDFHIVCRMLNQNVPSTPFVFTTLPLAKNRVSAEAQERIVEGIRWNSRDRYARPREGVECDLMKSWVMADKNQDTAKVH